MLFLSCTALPFQPYQGAYQPSPGYAAPAPPPPVRRVASRGGAVVNYAGTGDGSRITFKLTTLNGASVRVEGMTSGNSGNACGGGFSGTGAFQGQTLVVQDETISACRFILTRAGRRLTVEEGMGCGSTHGPSCGFSGTLAQR